MTSTNTKPKTAETSDIQKAVDSVKPDAIAQNLASKAEVTKPEVLTEDQDTPFIAEDLRTDK